MYLRFDMAFSCFHTAATMLRVKVLFLCTSCSRSRSIRELWNRSTEESGNR
jgi:hypothetical protein